MLRESTGSTKDVGKESKFLILPAGMFSWNVYARVGEVKLRKDDLTGSREGSCV